MKTRSRSALFLFHAGNRVSVRHPNTLRALLCGTFATLAAARARLAYHLRNERGWYPAGF